MNHSNPSVASSNTSATANNFNLKHRREFLATTLAAGMALTVDRWTLANSNGADAIQIALLSDTHCPTNPEDGHRGFKPQENLRKVIEQALPTEAKTAFVCGDVSRLQGLLSDYETLKPLIQPLVDKMPTHFALGNHDDRSNFTKVFGSSSAVEALTGRKHVSIADIGPQRWIVLDSLMYVDKVPGFLGAEQRKWLDQTLASAPDRPTFLMVHHTLGEGDGDLLDADRLFDIASKHAQVHGIVFGHSHRWSIERRGNLHLINLPAIGYNFSDQEPIGWVLATVKSNSLQLSLKPVAGNLNPELMEATIPFHS